MGMVQQPFLVEKGGVVAVQYLAGYPTEMGQSRMLSAVILLKPEAATFNNERTTTP